MVSRGAFYIATGSETYARAEKSAQSLIEEMPDLPITIATDYNVSSSHPFDQVIKISNPKHSFLDKVENIGRSPYDRTLFLDADTYIFDDISELFDLLNRFDFAASQAGYRRIQYHPEQNSAVQTTAIPISYPEFNTGVMVFKMNDEIQTVFDRWEQIYQEHLSVEPSVNDQPAFLEAIYSTDVSVGTIPPAYNCRTPFVGYISQTVKIIHAKIENPKQVGRQLNKSPTFGRIFNSYQVNQVMEMMMIYDRAAGNRDLPDRLKWSRWIGRLRLAIRQMGVIRSLKWAYDELQK